MAKSEVSSVFIKAINYEWHKPHIGIWFLTNRLEKLKRITFCVRNKVYDIQLSCPYTILLKHRHVYLWRFLYYTSRGQVVHKA